ncbi:MAG: glycogen-binding domain-containing protein, partial [Gemmatimonadota bacterium]|nr:glycogen-binding domain-containing protein [Gemmatimonadota bacterium]
MVGVRRRLAAAGLVAVFGGAAPLGAQVTATTDIMLGAVGYEGFLGSGAASVAPGIRYDARTFSVAAQGSYLLYESGRGLVQAAGAAAWLSPALGPLRGEASAFGGLGSYAQAPAAGYGLARGRVHLMQRRMGTWASAGVGQAFAGADGAGTSELALGAWIAFPDLALSVTATHSRVRDSAYTDLSVSARWLHRVAEIDGIAGVRPASSIGSEGAFAELTARLALTRVVAAQVTAGRYLADPLRGSLAGRYLNAGIRITLAGGRSAVRAPDERLRSQLRLPLPLPPGAPELRVVETRLGTRALTIIAPGAGTVEIAGDFSDWQPVSLERRGGAWVFAVALPPGVHRLNVRLDGGPWVVPRGATPQTDEFGGTVGLI